MRVAILYYDNYKIMSEKPFAEMAPDDIITEMTRAGVKNDKDSTYSICILTLS